MAQYKNTKYNANYCTQNMFYASSDLSLLPLAYKKERRLVLKKIIITYCNIV